MSNRYPEDEHRASGHRYSVSTCRPMASMRARAPSASGPRQCHGLGAGLPTDERASFALPARWISLLVLRETLRSPCLSMADHPFVRS